MVINDTKILLVSPLPPPEGGIASWTKRYLDWSLNNGLGIDIVNTAVIGTRSIQINSERKISDEIKRTKDIITSIKQKLVDFRPDVVHLNTACGRFGIIRDYLCALYISKKRIPLIVHYRCNIEDQVNGKIINKYFLKKIALIANINLVLNTTSKEYLHRVSGKVGKIVANFIDETFILDEHRHINKKINNIVFVGHVQKFKGIEEIIETARYFPEITFNLAGPISYEIRNIKIPNNVILLGSIDNKRVIDLLKKSDLFLFPTYTEGFANALLEAMAMGLPIITTPVGANHDMIEDSGGIIVNVASISNIVSAINKMDSDINLREKMSIWNICKVKSNYEVDSIMKTLIEIYKEVVVD